MVRPRGASVLLPTAHLKHAETPDSLGLLPRSSPRPQKPAAQGVPPLLRHLGTPGGHRPRKNPGTSSHSDTKCCCLSVFHSVRRWAGVDSTAPKAPPTSAIWDSNGSSHVGSPSRFGLDVYSVIGRRGGCLWKRVSSRRTGGHSCLVDFLLSLWKLAQ